MILSQSITEITSFFFLNIGLDATLFELHPLSYMELSSLKSSFSNG